MTGSAKSRLTPLGLAVLGLALAAHAAAAAKPDAAPKAVGTIAGWGRVEVDRLPAPPGTTLFARDVVTTGAAAGAVLRLLSGDSARLGEDTEVSLAGPARLGLRRGGLEVAGCGLRFDQAASEPDCRSQISSQRAAEIAVPGAILALETASLFRVAATGSSAAIVVERGRVRVQGAGAPLVLAAGAALRLEDGVPQTSGPGEAETAMREAAGSSSAAGRVVQLYPEEVIQRAGQALTVSLRLGELISQSDRIRTSATGRVRIQLLGGSFVALGARSSMKLIRHDVDAHQTEIELEFGRLRAEVTKPASPQASFEVRTASAVVRGSAATFVIEAGTKLTRVCNAGPGAVSVRSIRPSLAGEVALHKDACVKVRQGSAPAEARAAEAGVRRELALTSFEGLPTIEHKAKIIALHEGATSADVLAAILAGVGYGVVNSAVNHIGDATSALQNAATQFGSTAAAFNGAASAANTASGVSAALCKAIETNALEFGVPVSPSGPGGFNCPP